MLALSTELCELSWILWSEVSIPDVRLPIAYRRGREKRRRGRKKERERERERKNSYLYTLFIFFEELLNPCLTTSDSADF